MAVTIERTGNPMFPWRVSSDCRTQAECSAKAFRLEEVAAAAFIPVEPSAHHAAEAPLPPFLADIPIPQCPDALAADADDDLGLKAGEALNPVSQADEE